MIIRLLNLLAAIPLLFAAAHQAPDSTTQTLESLLTDKGLNRKQVRQMLKSPEAEPDPQIVISNLFYSSPKAEVKKTQSMYIAPKYIKLGQEFIRDNREALDFIHKKYGVEPEVVTAILIVETKLGRYKPKYNVFHAYASLAACLDDDYLNGIIARYGEKYPALKKEDAAKRARKKGNWALNELYHLITLTEGLNLDPLAIKGSFSGAMGPAQFIPSSFARYGADGNNDGLRDPFDMDDAMASIANYLSRAGWKPGASVEKQRKAVWSYNHSQVYVNTIMHLKDDLKAP